AALIWVSCDILISSNVDGNYTDAYGLIFAGIDPVKAIKYQIMVTFMLLSTASLSTIIACYLTYRKFYNSRHQLVVTQLKKK
ncbi:ABC transporter permease, partial [Escherichia coli]